MKMSVGTRIVFSIYIIAVVILSLFLLGMMLGMVDTIAINDMASNVTGSDLGYKVLYIVIFVVMAIVGVALLFFGIRQTNPSTARVADFEIGSISITVKAIEELVEKYLRDFKDIKGLSIKVESFTNVIEILLQISVRPDIDIPDLTKRLQDGLTDNIQKLTGITVRKNKIMVMNIDDHMKSRVE